MREGDTLVNLFSWERRGFLSLSDTRKKELKSSVDLLFPLSTVVHSCDYCGKLWGPRPLLDSLITQSPLFMLWEAHQCTASIALDSRDRKARFCEQP